jgi:hypothetical protein
LALFYTSRGWEDDILGRLPESEEANMTRTEVAIQSRRGFLQFLAGSPLAAAWLR